MASGVEDFSQFGISKEVCLLYFHYFTQVSNDTNIFMKGILFYFQEKDKLVGEVIRHILFKNHQNSGCPIKRDELTQLITKNYHQRNFPTFVINEAKNKLSSVFGYEMRELQRTHPSSKSQTRMSQQSEHVICSSVLYF